MLFSAEVLSEDLMALGVTADPIWQHFNLVLSKVCGYSPIIGTDAEMIVGETELLMPDGLITINTPYMEFDKLMNELYYGK